MTRCTTETVSRRLARLAACCAFAVLNVAASPGAAAVMLRSAEIGTPPALASAIDPIRDVGRFTQGRGIDLRRAKEEL